MKIYTNIKVLKQVWAILKELELDGLLSGKELDLDFTKLVDTLLEHGKLNELCQVITQTDTDFEKMELMEIMQVVRDFFGNIGQSFAELNSLNATLKKQ